MIFFVSEKSNLFLRVGLTVFVLFALLFGGILFANFFYLENSAYYPKVCPVESGAVSITGEPDYRAQIVEALGLI